MPGRVAQKWQNDACVSKLFIEHVLEQGKALRC